jgi:hypothetical protein
MKIILFIVMLIAGSFSLRAQSVTPSVVNATGSYIQNGSYSLEYSLGEVAVHVYSSPKNKLSEGFLQPESIVINAMIPQDFYAEEDRFIYSPNTGEVKILSTDDIEQIDIYDLKGTRINSVVNTSTTIINPSLPEGIYLVTYKSEKGTINSIKILK